MTLKAPTPVAPGGTIGILGGGQLGRMLALAAARLGLRAHVYDPAPVTPAGQVAMRLTKAPFDDAQALLRFAWSVDVVTVEWETVPAAALEAIEASVAVHPPPRAVAVAQDRAAEKTFLNETGIATARWAPVDGPEDLAAAGAATGFPAILKTRRDGYDGKGQARVESADGLGSGFDAIGRVPAILEGVVDFRAEISAIAARGQGGEVAVYDPGLNVHRDGILHTTTVPAPLPRAVTQEAALVAGRILNALDYVGVIGVEFFVTAEGLLVNEIAPRVHNSGHWTLDACLVDQFEQHVRAICGWPLGDGSRHSDAVMTNLIGAEAEDWVGLAGQRQALHLYGKDAVRPGRKMGHVTRISPRRD